MNEPMTPDRIAAAEERCAKATPRPWAFWGGSVMKGNTPLLVLDNAPHFEQDCTYCANAEFAVGARTDLPDLLECRRELVEALKALVDCFGVCKTPSQFVAQIDQNGFIDEARAALRKAGAL